MDVRKQQLTKMLRNLEEAHAVSKMERCNFSRIAPEDKYPTNEQEANEFVKGRIRIWVNTWLEEPLEEAVKELRELLGIRE